MPPEKLVVIGNGMAAGRALEELFERAPARYDVTIFGAEPQVNYNRIMLSPVLAGEKAYDDIVIHDEAWYASNGVDAPSRRKRSSRSTARRRRCVAADGTIAAYDKLLIATGSEPVHPAGARARTCPASSPSATSTTSRRCSRAAERGGRAVVIGGGLLGLEAAAGLKRRGMDGDGRAPDADADGAPARPGRRLTARSRRLDARGIAVLTDGQDRGDPRRPTGCEAVRLDDGREIPADLVVMAVGIRPERRARQGRRARGQSRHPGRRRTCAPATPTSTRSANASSIAAGATAWSRRSRRWPRCAAARLAGDEDAAYCRLGHLDQAQGHRHRPVLGRRLRRAAEEREEIVLRDAARGVYKRLVIGTTGSSACVLYGEHRRRPLVLRPDAATRRDVADAPRRR